MFTSGEIEISTQNKHRFSSIMKITYSFIKIQIAIFFNFILLENEKRVAVYDKTS